MGFHLNIVDEPGGSAVSLAVVLSRQETNDLFLSGDSMISWPEEGLRANSDPFLARTSIFVSEVAARAQGMTLHYETREQAERTAKLLRLQLDRAGIAGEG